MDTLHNSDISVASSGLEKTPPPSAIRGRFPSYELRCWELSAPQTAVLAGVVILTALVYLHCLANGFFSDDIIMILKNPDIADWSFLWKSMTRDLWWFTNPDLNHAATTSFYQPMQSLWLGFGYHLFGTNPVGWHLAKIALHLEVAAHHLERSLQ